MNSPVPAPLQAAAPRQLEAFVQTEEARAAVQRILHQLGSTTGAPPREGSLSTAARMVGMTDFGDVLIAELDETRGDEAACEAIQALGREGQQVIVLGRRNDIATYRRLLAAGAADYLVLPLDGPFDIQLASGVTPPPAAVAPGTPSRVIGVCGVSGGVGASLLAANLAIALGQRPEIAAKAAAPLGPVALLDADLTFGSQAVDFDVPPTTGLLDALQSPGRVDRTFLGTTMAHPLPELSLFSAELADVDQLERYRNGLPDLIGRLRQDCPAIVIDLPRDQLMRAPTLARRLDDLILVLGPGFGSVRSFVKLMDRLGDTANSPRIWPILSHTRRDAGLKRAEIAETLEREITLELPHCGAELSRAQVKGQPLQLLAPRSAYARAVASLAQAITTPQDSGPSRRSFFARKRAKT
ncbi:AAA family ATPase [Pseudooceanicola sp. 200-1SW]|uniref:AAA family ATPase n=1 Tax=Pseudooceanicola sp. 200-1SW TaxID=3425949 RepID=UPI003D7F5FA6